jgi:hypothetical protein
VIGPIRSGLRDVCAMCAFIMQIATQGNGKSARN